MVISTDTCPGRTFRAGFPARLLLPWPARFVQQHVSGVGYNATICTATLTKSSTDYPSQLLAASLTHCILPPCRTRAPMIAHC